MNSHIPENNRFMIFVPEESLSLNDFFIFIAEMYVVWNNKVPGGNKSFFFKDKI